MWKKFRYPLKALHFNEFISSVCDYLRFVFVPIDMFCDFIATPHQQKKQTKKDFSNWQMVMIAILMHLFIV